ncbi:MAG: response regulator [Planctomycetes bacterium]|nr:response regulator [Planctomycetota bacterium]
MSDGAELPGRGGAADESVREVAALRAALRNSEEERQRLGATLDSIGDMVTVQDPDFRIIFQNKAMRDCVGNHVGEYCYSAYERRDSICTDCAMREAFRDGAVHRLEKSLAVPGRPERIEIVASALLDRDGICLAGIEVVRDLTELRRAEATVRASHEQLLKSHAELVATQRQVVQQERLRALGQLAAGIAHDFNNALAPVLGFAELLQDEPEIRRGTPKLRSYLDMILEGARGATDVVARLREFYRPRDPQEDFAPVPLRALLEGVVLLTRPKWRDQAQAAGRTILVELDPASPPEVICHESELREALVNLLFNAIDALPLGGTITLRARAQGEHVRIEVADTGTGMSEEVQRRCMEPFFTTKGAKGTGLGLAMVHGIMRRHQGRVEIESATGLGTTVSLLLPIGLPSGAGVATAPPSGPVRRLRVLVAEDEPLVGRMLLELLSSEGHAVQLAASGVEALEKFAAGRFDVVLTDRAMPEMNGDALALALKRAEPAIPVIMLTGFGALMNAHGEKPAGVDEVLAKPVTRAALRSTLEQVSARSIRPESRGAAGTSNPSS